MSMPDGAEIATTRRCIRAGRLDVEMEKTAPLRDREAVLAEGLVRCRTSPLFPRILYLRVSMDRICLVQHFAFRPDALVEIPRAAVTAVSSSGVWVRLEIHHEAGTLGVKVRPYEAGLVSGAVVERRLRVSSDELLRLLE
jgi:hypothetical protein